MVCCVWNGWFIIRVDLQRMVALLQGKVMDVAEEKKGGQQ